MDLKTTSPVWNETGWHQIYIFIENSSLNIDKKYTLVYTFVWNVCPQCIILTTKLYGTFKWCYIYW